MSLKSRARTLSATANISYQQAINALRSMGRAPADWAKKHNWPLPRADAYCFDHNLDEEYSEVVTGGTRHVDVLECENCWTGYFQGSDKKGMVISGSDRFCSSCIAEHDVWQCDRCGQEQLGLGDGSSVCGKCWRDVINND